MFTTYSTKYPHAFCTVCANPTFHAVWCLLFTNRFFNADERGSAKRAKALRSLCIYIHMCVYTCLTMFYNSGELKTKLTKLN